ncbi:uncharacterized protein LOC129951568 [Eupeodes corollae]|uniref:uncharacterized protein LOC129951568 n=1 Tax=Eupeodes corollae TaxID=290404 RepID=UPI002491C82D|nr:uncharacterized protein LOC129951568 [Eupeodes corollae]
MDKLCFQFVVKAGDDAKSNFIFLTTITTPEGKEYSMPDQHQQLKFHNELAKTPIYAKIKNSLQRRHQMRKVWITLTKELREIYLDEENVQFKDYLLEETIQSAQPTGTGITEDVLKRVLSTLDKGKSEINKPFNSKKLAERFVLDKFGGKSADVIQWINTFESECERFEINKDADRIEIFRLFLESSGLDWYSSMLIKFTLDSKWKEWRDNFCETYANKGWSSVKYAITFRYVNGALLDYALKKERFLLELNKSMDKRTLLDLIVVGLPEFITDRINRDSLKNTEDLFTELRSLEHLIKRRTIKEKKNSNYNVKEQTVMKKPCEICEKLNKKNRFHPESSCWFKTKSNEDSKNVKCINNSELECELMHEIPKN